MIIKRDKDYKLYCYITVFFCVCLMLIYILGLGKSLGFAFLINSPVFLIMILGLISSGRTIIFDKDGVTVCFWKYCKKYTWNQLKTKRVEAHHLPSIFAGNLMCPYLKEAIFSPYKIHKPKIMRASFYSIFHPLSCIYVNFSIENDNYRAGRYYEMTEAVFWSKMEEWGVNITKIDEKTWDGFS